jgi:hypothetical protein
MERRGRGLAAGWITGQAAYYQWFINPVGSLDHDRNNAPRNAIDHERHEKRINHERHEQHEIREKATQINNRQRCFRVFRVFRGYCLWFSL